jgi:hypothetical protein
MNQEFPAGATRRYRIGVWMGALSLCALAIAGMGRPHAAPGMPAVQLAQAQQGDGDHGQDTGMSGSQAGPQSGGPAMDQHDEGQAHRRTGTSGSAGAGSAGAADAQGRRTGNDTQTAPSGGASNAGDGAKGTAADSDKGPGHRGNDTKPGH